LHFLIVATLRLLFVDRLCELEDLPGGVKVVFGFVFVPIGALSSFLIVLVILKGSVEEVNCWVILGVTGEREDRSVGAL
jgi:hypothetical protein